MSIFLCRCPAGAVFHAESQGQEGRRSVFKFPKEADLRDKWIKQINRKYFTPSSSAVVCAAHFPTEAVITEDTARRPDGTILTVKRDCGKLTKGAYPTIFPNQPKYLTKHTVPQQKSPSERQILLEARDEHVFQSWCENNLISSLNCLR